MAEHGGGGNKRFSMELMSMASQKYNDNDLSEERRKELERKAQRAQGSACMAMTSDPLEE